MRQMKRARGGRKPRLSKEEMASREKAIIDDIRGGVLSYREIALKHGVSLPTVNNKARKAGISRGRRKGASIVVTRPRRKVRGRRKAARRPARRVARRGRRPAALLEPMPQVARRPRRKAGRRKAAARRGAPRGRRASKAGFAEALRALVLKHYPQMSLQKFDRLSRLIEVQAG